MEYIKEINIMEAVIHVLDNNSDEPIINKFKMELNEETYNFIYKHITKALGREDLRYAKFNQEARVIKEVSQAYLNGENELGKASEEIAKQMFSLMKSNGNINSCDLLITSFSTEFGVMLGILKLDYIKNYKHKIDFINNEIGINIVQEFIGLPSSTKLQKCAFIKPMRKENVFDLMAIDEISIKNNDEDYGVNWFTNDFIGCSIIENERDSTKKLLAATEKFVRNNYKEDANEAEIVRSKVKNEVLKNDDIDIAELAEEIFGVDNEENENFIEVLKSQGVEESIKVDKEFAEKKLAKHKIKVNVGIELNISDESYSDKSKFEIIKNYDGSINMVIKNIVNYIEK